VAKVVEVQPRGFFASADSVRQLMQQRRDAALPAHHLRARRAVPVMDPELLSQVRNQRARRRLLGQGGNRPTKQEHCEPPPLGPSRPGDHIGYYRRRALTVDDMNEEVLVEARQAQERLIQAEEHAGAVRADFRRAVHRLVVGGSSPPDIAAALGLSDQQLD
jgi:hypothetical protein